MIGTAYWSTGITLTHLDGRWSATLNYLDDGFCDDDTDAGRISTQGTLHTRYLVRDGRHVDALTAVVDALKVDAERLGIVWRGALDPPTLYVDVDRSDLPDGWRELVAGQAARIGWVSEYGPAAVGEENSNA